MTEPYVKDYLMTAGPTPLPPAVSQVMAEPMLYHRAPAFVEVYARCLDRIKQVFWNFCENAVRAMKKGGTLTIGVEEFGSDWQVTFVIKVRPLLHRLPPNYRSLEVDFVDLRALQLAAVVDVDRLPLGEDVEHLRARLAVAVAGGLRAAKR